MLPPLQSHNKYVATWHPPPPGQFTQLDASDEDWARPLGIGRVTKKLAELYDVLNADGDLLGYTHLNPSTCCDDFVSIPVMASDADSVLTLDAVTRRDHMLRDPAYRIITIHTHTYVVGTMRHEAWFAHTDDAIQLLDAGFLTCLGNRREARRYLQTMAVKEAFNARWRR